jgi:hypothetical protein
MIVLKSITEPIKHQPVNVVVLYVIQKKRTKIMLDKKEKRLFLSPVTN